MNLNSIRKNYDALSLRERNSVYWKALMRNDESEMDAIVSASPKFYFRIVDIAKFADDVLSLHLLNLIERLNYSAIFDLFIELSKETNEENCVRVFDSVLWTGYLYRIETDAWKAVGDEFGFDVEEFRERLSKDCLAVEQMQIKDELMRKYSFKDEGVSRILEENGMNPTDVKTLETQIEKYRRILINTENRFT